MYRQLINQKRLICIPYAGGTQYFMNPFKKHFDQSIEVQVLELPGRGKRLTEPLVSSLPDLVDDLYKQIIPLLDQPFVLYGHSMGGMLGNLLLQRLVKEGQPLPLLFVVTGCAAPQFRKNKKILHQLGDHEFSIELDRLGGFPQEIMSNKELMAFFLPIIRSDIKALETYQYQLKQLPYSIPITAVAGTLEKMTDEQLLGWKLETSAAFRSFRLPGNHFFILSQFETIANIVHEAFEAARKDNLSEAPVPGFIDGHFQ